MKVMLTRRCILDKKPTLLLFCFCSVCPVHCAHPPCFYSLTVHMRALTNRLSHSIMASNRVKAEGAARPAQQTAEWIYIQSRPFLLLVLLPLLLWSLTNSRESINPINVPWSVEQSSLQCCFLCEWVYMVTFSFACHLESGSESGSVISWNTLAATCSRWAM